MSIARSRDTVVAAEDLPAQPDASSVLGHARHAASATAESIVVPFA
jgi:hypothetical protein